MGRKKLGFRAQDPTARSGPEFCAESRSRCPTWWDGCPFGGRKAALHVIRTAGQLYTWARTRKKAKLCHPSISKGPQGAQGTQGSPRGSPKGPHPRGHFWPELFNANPKVAEDLGPQGPFPARVFPCKPNARRGVGAPGPKGPLGRPKGALGTDFWPKFLHAIQWPLRTCGPRQGPKWPSGAPWGPKGPLGAPKETLGAQGGLRGPPW